MMIIGAIFYFGTAGKDQQVINPRFGIFAHRQFFAGLLLILASWLVKFIIYWIDPSVPMFGPEFMWYRMSGGQSDYYDGSFMQ